jgi:diguanylate cyclase (GGDEF)-like protein
MLSPPPLREPLSEAEVFGCLAQAEVGAMVLDAAGRVLAINPFLSGLLGRAPPLPSASILKPARMVPGPLSLQRQVRAARVGRPHRDTLSLCGADGVRLQFAFRWRGQVSGTELEADLLECHFIGLQTERQALEDGLAVGGRVLGRPEFEEAVCAALEHARGMGVPCSLLSIGVDRLDQVDRTAGARALRRFAESCVAVLREGDRVGLIDRRRFAILLPGSLAKNALRVAERLRVALNTGNLESANEPRFTVSIGVVTSRTGRSGYAALCSRANAKREDARQRGGNRING